MEQMTGLYIMNGYRIESDDLQFLQYFYDLITISEQMYITYQTVLVPLDYLFQPITFPYKCNIINPQPQQRTIIITSIPHIYNPIILLLTHILFQYLLFTQIDWTSLTIMIMVSLYFQ